MTSIIQSTAGMIAVQSVVSFDESAGAVQVCATLSTVPGDTTEEAISITLTTSDDTGEAL